MFSDLVKPEMLLPDQVKPDKSRSSKAGPSVPAKLRAALAQWSYIRCRAVPMYNRRRKPIGYPRAYQFRSVREAEAQISTPDLAEALVPSVEGAMAEFLRSQPRLRELVSKILSEGSDDSKVLERVHELMAQSLKWFPGFLRHLATRKYTSPITRDLGSLSMIHEELFKAIGIILPPPVNKPIERRSQIRKVYDSSDDEEEEKDDDELLNRLGRLNKKMEKRGTEEQLKDFIIARAAKYYSKTFERYFLGQVLKDSSSLMKGEETEEESGPVLDSSSIPHRSALRKFSQMPHFPRWGIDKSGLTTKRAMLLSLVIAPPSIGATELQRQAKLLWGIFRFVYESVFYQIKQGALHSAWIGRYPRKGRPFYVRAKGHSPGHTSVPMPVVAGTQVSKGATTDWSVIDYSERLEDEAPLSPAPFSDLVLSTVVKSWQSQAQSEHASVASFAHHTLELLKFGAPAALVNAAMAAGQDEVKHAQLCFQLASKFYNQGSSNSNGLKENLHIGPSPMRDLDHRAIGLSASMTELAGKVARDGCIGETTAVLVAARQLAKARHPEVRMVLRKVVHDEIRHAALAWRTLFWALHSTGEEIWRHVSSVFEMEQIVDQKEPTRSKGAHDLSGRDNSVKEATDATMGSTSIFEIYGVLGQKEETDVERNIATELVLRLIKELKMVLERTNKTNWSWDDWNPEVTITEATRKVMLC